MLTIPHIPSGKIAGIYAIVHVSSYRIYIGSAVHIARRWEGHLSKLNLNTHENRYLQQTWNKYGPDAFEWLILEEVLDAAQLLSCEQYWIDFYHASKRDKGFNINPKSSSGFGRKLTEEQKRYQSVRQKAMQRKQTEHQKQAVSKALQGNKHGADKSYCGVLTETDVINIFSLVASGNQPGAVAKLYSVHLATVSRIIHRKTWDHISIPDNIVKAAQQTAKHSRGKHVFTEDDVRTIKARLARGDSICIIAEEYGVNHANISSIRRGKTWLHITDFTPLSGPPIRLRSPRHLKSGVLEGAMAVAPTLTITNSVQRSNRLPTQLRLI